MVIAVDAERRWDYITVEDQKAHKMGNEDLRTTFHLSSMTPAQVAEVTDMGIVYDKVRGTQQHQIGAVTLRILTYGLKGWTNLRDKRGEILPCPESVIARVALLPEVVRAELAGEIRFGAEMTADEGN